MEQVFQWLLDNWASVAQVTGLGAVLTYAMWYIKTKIVPMILQKVIVILAKVVSNLFGSNTDDADPVVAALPIIGQLQDSAQKYSAHLISKVEEASEASRLSGEVQLLAMKEKLASPLYTAIEKMPIQAAFDYLYDKLKASLSPEFLEVLNKFEQI